LDLFIRKDYAAIKTQDISQAVVKSEGLSFHYFETKKKFNEELIKIGISKPKNVLSGGEGYPLEFFQISVKKIIRHVKTNPFVAKLFVLMKQAHCNDAAPEPVKKCFQNLITSRLQ